jgi:hypothetical protein
MDKYPATFKFFVNDIQMPGRIWSYDDHFALTGQPETWRVEGDADKYGVPSPPSTALAITQPSEYGFPYAAVTIPILYSTHQSGYPYTLCLPQEGVPACTLIVTDIRFVAEGTDSVQGDWLDYAKTLPVNKSSFNSDYSSSVGSHVGCAFAGSLMKWPIAPELITKEGGSGSASQRGASVVRVYNNPTLFQWHYIGVVSTCEWQPAIVSPLSWSPGVGYQWAEGDHQFKHYGDLGLKFVIVGTPLEAIFDTYEFTKIEQAVTMELTSHYAPELL